jgi:hydrogenase maturation factor HypF (carbamoyltransferase family)
MTNLKLCPFCDSKAKLENLNDKMFWVSCENKKCGIETGVSHIKDKVIRIWNTGINEVSNE